MGTELPISSTTRLLPTRDIEKWELSPAMSSNLVQVRGSVTPRCRHVLYSTSRRTDVGTFKRVGSGYWTAVAITTGAAGGGLGGFGFSGWFSSLYPSFGRPMMYGVGGALAAGGLVSCFAGIANPTKVRLSLCGILTGLGGAFVTGAVISSLPGTGSATGMTSTGLIDVPTFQTLMITGGALAGVSVLSGLVSVGWRDSVERERTTDIENPQAWDPQSGEQNCGGSRPIAGRTASLEITAEHLTEGLGSDASPLKMRVVMTGQASQAIDLRGLRAALPSCGAFTVRLVPEIMYEESPSDDFLPPVLPGEMHSATRPIHGSVSPREGISLPAGNPDAKPSNKLAVPGISADVLSTLERRCRGETGPVSPAPLTREARPTPVRAPAREAPAPAAALPTEPAVPAATPPERVPTTSGTPPVEAGECSAHSKQLRYVDCENQCGRTLEATSCLFEFRKCHLAARTSTQPTAGREACDLAWEQCLDKVRVPQGGWRRCVDTCVQGTEPSACRSNPE